MKKVKKDIKFLLIDQSIQKNNILKNMAKKKENKNENLTFKRKKKHLKEVLHID